MTTPDPHPWERQQGETNPAYHAFITYRDLDPLERSTQRVTSELGGKVKPAMVNQWRSRFGWYDRARSWDDEQDRRRREQLLKKAVREADRVADQASKFQRLFAVPVVEFMRRYESEDPMEREHVQEEIRELSVAQLLQLATITARPFTQMWATQQEAYGVSTQHLVVQQRVTSDQDPYQTNESYFAKVVVAWQEAGLLPELKPAQQRQLEQKAGGSR